VAIRINTFDHYPADTGCEVSPTCLHCPLEECRYDNPIYFNKWLDSATNNKTKRIEIYRLLDTTNLTSRQIAAKVGFQAATVRRIKRRRGLVKG